MRFHSMRSSAVGALAALLVLAAAACGPSLESQRHAARANADKYYELVTAGDYEGAFRKTFSDSYRQQLDIDTFVDYQQGYAKLLGGIQGYRAVQVDVDQERGTATILYALDVGRYPEPVNEVIRLDLEGSEWRISSVEPKVVRQQHVNPAPPAGAAPQAPQGPPAGR